MPISPSSPIRLTVSCGKRESRSISAAMGLIWVSANSRAVTRTRRGHGRAARLSDLEPQRPPARVPRGPRGADRGADDTAELFQDHVVLRPLHAATAGDDGLGLGELGEPCRDFLASLDE